MPELSDSKVGNLIIFAIFIYCVISRTSGNVPRNTTLCTFSMNISVNITSISLEKYIIFMLSKLKNNDIT